jgi:hypothetical protein
MPTVFLSYSRADLPLIEQLIARIQTPTSDITIWRDQERIYGGQKWPKVWRTQSDQVEVRGACKVTFIAT